MTKSVERLSSAHRINRAGDDAAGLAKSEKLRADIRGLEQAQHNAQDAIGFVQIGEGALDDVHAMLQRINELAVAAANTASSDGSAEQAEVVELLRQIDVVGATTSFAGIRIFGNPGATFHIGAERSDSMVLAAPALSAGAITDGVVAPVSLSSLDLTTDAGGAIETVRSAISAVTGLRSRMGAQQNRLEHTLRSLATAAENLRASESRIRDVDIAEETVSLTRQQIMLQAGTAMLAQANNLPRGILALISG